MCSALVSPHGFKNDVYFTSSVRLFRLMAEPYVTRELTSESPIDSCQSVDLTGRLIIYCCRRLDEKNSVAIL